VEAPNFATVIVQATAPSPTPTPVPGSDGDIDRSNANAAGNGDGNVDQKDLFWFDQFSRGLHCPGATPYNEFQRADGNDNGSLDGGDYTYIGNVFLGISPKVAATGPSALPQNFCFGVPAGADLDAEAAERAAPVEEEINDLPRGMKLVSIPGGSGSDVYVDLVMNAQGDERSTSTSIHWDPTVMTIDSTNGFNVNPDVQPGSGAAGGQLIGVNANDVSNGNLGLLIDFTGGNGDSPIPAGSRQIVRLHFHIKPDAPAGAVSRIEFTDAVVPRQTVDIKGHTANVQRYEPLNIRLRRSPVDVKRTHRLAPIETMMLPIGLYSFLSSSQ